MTSDKHQWTRRMLISLGGMALGATALGRSMEAAPLSAVDKRNVDTVIGWSAAWKSGDAERLASFVHDGFAFRGNAQQMEIPPTVGKANFAKVLQSVLRTTKIDMHVTDVFALAPVVVTAHHQLFDSEEQGRYEDLYIGVFFVEDGLIREWIDYAIIPGDRRQRPQKNTASKGRFIHVPVRSLSVKP